MFLRRKQLGQFFKLVKEMRRKDHESYFAYFRMLPDNFDYLLSLVKPLIRTNSKNIYILIIIRRHLCFDFNNVTSLSILIDRRWFSSREQGGVVEFIFLRCECSQARCEFLANCELRARFWDEWKTDKDIHYIKPKPGVVAKNATTRPSDWESNTRPLDYKISALTLSYRSRCRQLGREFSIYINEMVMPAKYKGILIIIFGIYTRCQ